MFSALRVSARQSVASNGWIRAFSSLDGKPLRGSVKWFDSVKGYGFIKSEDEPRDIFVHWSDIAIEDNGFRTLRDAEHVEFIMVEDRERGKPKATAVKKLSTHAKQE